MRLTIKVARLEIRRPPILGGHLKLFY
jgi:hypothetical protein